MNTKRLATANTTSNTTTIESEIEEKILEKKREYAREKRAQDGKKFALDKQLIDSEIESDPFGVIKKFSKRKDEKLVTQVSLKVNAYEYALFAALRTITGDMPRKRVIPFIEKELAKLKKQQR